MIIAKELRKENIAEYIIYMFQLEDLVRAYQGDMSLIYEKHIRHFNVDSKTLAEIKNWYETLCKMMKEENLMEKGHLQFLKHKMQELEHFHWQLLNSSEYANYKQLFYDCQSDLEAFKNKSNMTNMGDIEPALTALYSLFLMRLRKLHITNETSDAMDKISRWLSLLAKYYRDFENGKLEIY
ncbi:MAG: DUF4924 family protein [Bacteroidales bacterium]|nr:DUF4924 family protein [Bacteroidales bacterium]